MSTLFNPTSFLSKLTIPVFPETDITGDDVSGKFDDNIFPFPSNPAYPFAIFLFAIFSGINPIVFYLLFHIDFSLSDTNLLFESWVIIDGGWFSGWMYRFALSDIPDNLFLSAVV